MTDRTVAPAVMYINNLYCSYFHKEMISSHKQEIINHTCLDEIKLRAEFPRVVFID